jgi:predicted negative regulator of RcsB-dependent stress response
VDIHASEKEQVEALKKWWKDNGSSVVTGVLLGLAVLLGTKAWFSYQQNQALSASNIYAQMMGASGAHDQEKAQAAANELISKYSGSGYAPLAALLLAAQAVDNGELPAAQAQLQWALDNAKSPQVQNTARTRLIRILIAQQQYAEADNLIAAVKDAGAYAYVYSELKGDLAQAQGQTSAAAAAYKLALEQMPPQAPSQPLLNAKYESLGGAGETAQ